MKTFKGLLISALALSMGTTPVIAQSKGTAAPNAKVRKGAELLRPNRASGFDVPTPVLIAIGVGAAAYFAFKNDKDKPASP